MFNTGRNTWEDRKNEEAYEEVMDMLRDIANKSPYHGNALMELLGDNKYFQVMTRQTKSGLKRAELNRAKLNRAN